MFSIASRHKAHSTSRSAWYGRKWEGEPFRKLPFLQMVMNFMNDIIFPLSHKHVVLTNGRVVFQDLCDILLVLEITHAVKMCTSFLDSENSTVRVNSTSSDLDRVRIPCLHCGEVHVVERSAARRCSLKENLGYLVELSHCVSKAQHDNFWHDTHASITINLFLFPLRDTKPYDLCPSVYLINIGLESCALGFSELEDMRLCEGRRHLPVEVRSFRIPWLRNSYTSVQCVSPQVQKRRGKGRARRSVSRASDIQTNECRDLRLQFSRKVLSDSSQLAQ